jgi:hypothetical protein
MIHTPFNPESRLEFRLVWVNTFHKAWNREDKRMRPILVKDNRMAPESQRVWRISENPLGTAGGDSLIN